MTELTLNVPLLRKMVKWVEEQEALPRDRREWRQDWWAQPAPCGTAYCVAGKIATDAGHTVDRYNGHIEDGRHAAAVARQLLRASSHNRDNKHGYLFAAHNTAADIRRIAEHMAGERL